MRLGIMGITQSFAKSQNREIFTKNRKREAELADYVQGEYLMAELSKKVDESDYFARSMKAIDDHIPNFFGEEKSMGDLMNYDSSQTFNIDEVDILAEPGYLPIESGLVRRPDGSWFMAIHTNFGKKINGEMFDWWISNCDDDEKYKYSHPLNNVECTWDETFYSHMPFERKRCYFIDHIQYVTKHLTGIKVSFQIEYLRPSKYFDISQFHDKKISAVVVGRIYNDDPALGIVGFGYIVHVVRETGNKNESECRTRIWLGDIVYPETLDNFLYARWLNYFVSFPFYKALKLPNALAEAIYISFSEEMSSLSSFLPHYYASSKAFIDNEINWAKTEKKIHISS